MMLLIFPMRWKKKLKKLTNCWFLFNFKAKNLWSIPLCSNFSSVKRYANKKIMIFTSWSHNRIWSTLADANDILDTTWTEFTLKKKKKSGNLYRCSRSVGENFKLGLMKKKKKKIRLDRWQQALWLNVHHEVWYFYCFVV